MQIISRIINNTWIIAIIILYFNTASAKVICSVTSATLSFGSLDQTTLERSSTQINVQCNNTGNSTKTGSYTLQFSSGGSTDSTKRKMYKLGTLNTKNYNIYSSPTTLEILGDGLNGTKTIIGQYYLPKKSAQPKSYIIYANAPAEVTALPGDYSDNIIITLSY